MKKAVIREEKHYVVDLYENGDILETRSLYGKSLAYAESLAENWEQGVLNLDNSRQSKTYREWTKEKDYIPPGY